MSRIDEVVEPSVDGPVGLERNFVSSVAWAQQSVEISKEALHDKIRGAWAAQTIGVTYGFPVEFKFNSVRVPDDHELPWHEDYLYEMFTQNPNIYDDIYIALPSVKRFRSMEIPLGKTTEAGVTPVDLLTDVLIIRCTMGKYLDHLLAIRLSNTMLRRWRNTSLFCRSTIAFCSLEYAVVR